MTSEFYIKPPSSKGRAPSKALRRGRACTNCRLLKIKCDGIKPVCGPCDRNDRPDPCEYTDHGGSRTKALEETITRLEARIHELEHPDASTPSVTLHAPYGNQNAPSSPDELSPIDELSLYSPASTSSPRLGTHTYSPVSTSSPGLGSSVSSGSSIEYQAASASIIGIQEPPPLIIQTLLDTFLPHATEFGFFLHIPRFRSSSLQQLPFGHYSRPSPALLSTMYLWGATLSRSEPLQSHEGVFLLRALEHTGAGLSSAHPHKILHTIQAQVLLSQYFFRNGRSLEAKYHANAAVSLTLACGLHQIRSVQPLSWYDGSLGNVGSVMAPLRDDIDEGERINAFWSVFILRKCSAVVLEPPSTLCGSLEAPGMQIDSPWPLDMKEYEEGVMSPNLRGSFTVRNFLNEYPGQDGDGLSTMAMHAKAAIMYHRAAHLAAQWTPNFQQRESHAFTTAFTSLDRLIDKFKSTLPPLDQFRVTTHFAIRTHVVIQSLAHAATIKLHSIFARRDGISNQKCTDAARQIVGLTRDVSLQEFACINPILGTLWMDACQVFVAEISYLRAPGAWAPNETIGMQQELFGCLEIGLSAMSTFEDTPLMRYQLSKIREAYAAI